MQRLYAGELTLTAEAGLAPGFGIEATLPVRLVTTRIRYEDPAGRPYVPVPPDPHHRDETLTGLGDPWLLGHVGRASGDWSAAGRLGIALPLGSTVDDPFALGRQGLPHEHIQFGTGTFDPLLGAAGERRFPGWSLAATALSRLVLYENAHGYRGGHRVFGTLAAASALGTTSFRFTGGADVFHEAAERWHGLVQEEGNLGRTDVLVDVGATRRWGRSSLSLAIKVPVLVRAVGAQLSYPAIVTLSVGSQLGATAR